MPILICYSTKYFAASLMFKPNFLDHVIACFVPDMNLWKIHYKA